MSTTSYMVPIMKSAEMKILKDNGIIATQFDDSNILINENDSKAFCNLMGVNINELTPSGYDGVLIAILSSKKPNKKQSKSSEAGDAAMPKAVATYKATYTRNSDQINDQIFDTLVNEVAPILNMNISIGYYKGQQTEIRTKIDDTFCVAYNMINSPLRENSSAEKFPETTWGLSLAAASGNYNIHPMIANGFHKIYADDNKTILALLSEDKLTLHLLVDVLWKSSNKGVKSHCTILFKHIIAAAIKLISDKEAVVKREDRINEEWCKDKAIINKIMPLRENELERIEQEECNTRVKVSDLQHNLNLMIQRNRHLNQQLFMLRNNKEDTITAMRKQIQALRRMPLIKSVDIATNKENQLIIAAMTGMLHCIDPRTKKEHELGEFLITVNFNKTKIYWFNMTRRVTTPAGRDMNAPHIFYEGNACLGTWAESLPEVMAQNDIVSALTMAIAYAESVNVADSAGQYIEKWPLSKRQIEKDKTPEGIAEAWEIAKTPYVEEEEEEEEEDNPDMYDDDAYEEDQAA